MKGVTLDALCKGGESAPDSGTTLGLFSRKAFWLLCRGWTEVVLLSVDHEQVPQGLVCGCSVLLYWQLQHAVAVLQGCSCLLLDTCLSADDHGVYPPVLKHGPRSLTDVRA